MKSDSSKPLTERLRAATEADERRHAERVAAVALRHSMQLVAGRKVLAEVFTWLSDFGLLPEDIHWEQSTEWVILELGRPYDAELATYVAITGGQPESVLYFQIEGYPTVVFEAAVPKDAPVSESKLFAYSAPVLCCYRKFHAEFLERRLRESPVPLRTEVGKGSVAAMLAVLSQDHEAISKALEKEGLLVG